MEQEIFNTVTGFDWDKYNAEKIFTKHKVTTVEVEETFLNEHLIGKDEKHSLTEDRYYLFGQTNSGRLLTVVFSIRSNRIRVITARDMSRKERRCYHEKIKKTTEI